ncbi:hypothetical protein JTB14_027210 [Gonioctena quinquepunctata]|nr:hypothetical protein JTB14_027210 [Gonioctena quinquepunctata]
MPPLTTTVHACNLGGLGCIENFGGGLSNTRENLNTETIIYTDGSKDPQGEGAAFAVPDKEIIFRGRIPSICSIFSTEANAIEKALSWCLDNNIRESPITSDSKSVLEGIKHIYKNFHVCRIGNSLHKLSRINCEVIFIWVKGHSGISGSELVDEAA